MMVLEAMKMETSVSSDRDGVIKAVRVAAGDSVQSGQPLVDFQ
jgi:biotin carboxyl carrier protein